MKNLISAQSVGFALGFQPTLQCTKGHILEKNHTVVCFVTSVSLRHQIARDINGGILARSLINVPSVVTVSQIHCKHQKAHFGIKEFKCMQCEKCFVTAPELKRHNRIHTGEKPFKCTWCDKCFADSSNLHRHQRTHIKVTPHPLAGSMQAQVHSSGKAGEKLYSCNECGKAFRLV